MIYDKVSLSYLIKDPADPAKHKIIVNLFFILGKYVSSASRRSDPSLLVSGAG